MTQFSDLLARSAGPVAREYTDNFRVLVLNGPRQAGKTTLMRQLIAADGGELRNLDDEAQLAAARRDPIGFVSSEQRPMYIDEVQRAGDPLVRAVKLAVDNVTASGQFVLAGSTRFLSEPSLGESLAGRAALLEVLPFTQGELEERRETFLDLAFGEPAQLRHLPGMTDSRIDYLERMVRGGFPEPARMAGPRARTAWFANYIRAVTERDLREMARINEPSAAGRVLRGLAAMSAQSLVTTSLAQKAELPRATVDRYVELLDAVFLIHRLQPWSRNPLTQAVRRPKVHLIDAGLLCHLLGVGAQSLATPTSAAVGAVAETFVAMELRKQATWAETDVRLYHYRDSHGHAEIDVIAEAADGRVVGIEVKASQTVGGRDFHHLGRLATRLGSDFAHGFVVYLGQQVLAFGERLTAVPLGALWAPTR